jgi:transcriptional regulator NrdR family protein
MKYAAGFVCPHCGARTLVLDSRRRDDETFRRRRECTECNLRFTTAEVIVRPVYTSRKAAQDASDAREADSLTRSRQDQNNAPVTRGRASE